METFAELIERHKETVFRTLARLVGRDDELEDLAQEVFLRAFRGLAQFRGKARFSTWLYRITINVANDELRRRGRLRATVVSIDDEDAGWKNRLSDPAPEPAEGLDRNRFLEVLNASLDDLSLRKRAILTLYYQEERSYEEIVSILDLRMGTVKTELHRARARLRIAMKERMAKCKTAS